MYIENYFLCYHCRYHCSVLAFIIRDPALSSYSLFSTVTLTGRVDPTANFVILSWKSYCTNDYNGGYPSCFPRGQTSQTIAGTSRRCLRCSARIVDAFPAVTITSDSFTLAISGKPTKVTFGLTLLYRWLQKQST